MNIPPVLLADSYDSFSYNIAQILDELGAPFEIVKNDAIDFASLGRFSGAIISPGPGLPGESGRITDLVGEAERGFPVLGICLGHQAVCEHFGARLKNIEPAHGKVSRLRILGDFDGLFRGFPREGAEAGRYHSWSVAPSSLPDCLEATAVSEDGEIMAVRHRVFNARGVQFHPESAMTPLGAALIANWIGLLGRAAHVSSCKAAAPGRWFPPCKS